MQPAILSGPSFADDVARGLPTAVTLAATDEELASMLVQALGSSTFRPYHTTDIRGVEIGGAAKNVLAIAAGIVVGRKLGASAQAALTTRGFSELVRLGNACGARGETMAGLSGLGDLILSLLQVRNRAIFHSASHWGVARRRREENSPKVNLPHPCWSSWRASKECRYAGIAGGGGNPERRNDDRRRDRMPADAAVQGGGMFHLRHARACRGHPRLDTLES